MRAALSRAACISDTIMMRAACQWTRGQAAPGRLAPGWLGDVPDRPAASGPKCKEKDQGHCGTLAIQMRDDQELFLKPESEALSDLFPPRRSDRLHSREPLSRNGFHCTSRCTHRDRAGGFVKQLAPGCPADIRG